MNFQERVQVYGVKDGVQTHLGSMLRNPFSVAVQALVDVAKDFGADDDPGCGMFAAPDESLTVHMESIIRTLREHLHANHHLPELELDFEKAAQ